MGSCEHGEGIHLLSSLCRISCPSQEIAEGTFLIDIAHEAGAKRILWSGLISFNEASNGKFTAVLHFEGKARITKYGRLKFAGTDVAFVNVIAGLYMQNFTRGPNPIRPMPRATARLSCPSQQETG